jgi:esterase
MGGTRLPHDAFESFRSLGELGAAEYLTFRRQVAPLAPEAELERLVAVGANFRAEVVRSVADVWNDGYPAGERPSGFAGPVLVVRGADDPLLTAEIVAARVAERFDPARTTVTAIEKSGHWPHLERPSAVAAAMNRFLADNLATRATSSIAKNG